ncbi:MAG TPA: serine hydrolase domain-containing protein [Ilumatobacteraceae bacterium]|nr:serine hydrolase domain-containing protein [Ilumatobacteraceae bacterium]
MEGFVHPDFAPVTEKVQQLMAKKSALGGMAVAVYHRGELVVDAWTGERNAAGDPWTRDTMSMSFSTTKGVVATIVHRLVDRGVLDYDVPVASYWPEFATAGKEAITLRHLLSHQAALHDVRALVDSTESLLDWDHMTRLLAEAAPAWEIGTRSGYHALTYGWLVGEVIRRVTGMSVNENLQREIVEPLGITGMYIGAPAEVRGNIATQLVDPASLGRLFRMTQFLSRYERYRPLFNALVVDDIVDVAATDHIHDGEIPAANGVFTARSLARMYAALATPDDFDGPPLVSAATMREATRVQTLGDGRTGVKVGRDAAVLINMRWRLGYHLVGTTKGVLPQAFGHFGFGGSGAWGDPESGLAMAMILNQVGGTPFGDTKMLRLGAAAVRSAQRRTTNRP